MLRDKWEFEVLSKELAQAALNKMSYHQLREQTWRGMKDEVMAEIRATGIDISESAMGANYANTALITPQISIKPDLQRRLTECHNKIQEHQKKSQEYSGWHQTLDTQRERLKLHQDDWLYFYGE